MAKAKKGSKKKIIFSVLGLLIVAIIVLVVVASSKENFTEVKIENVKKRTLTQLVNSTGKIYPVNQVVLRPEVAGEIVELPVIEGQKVEKGDLLIRVKPDLYVARRNRAKESLNSAKSNLTINEATLERIESEFKRVSGLYAKKLASDKELEIAKASLAESKGRVAAQKAAVEQAKASYSEAQADLAKTAIYSPISGTITQLNVELSERVLGSSFNQGTHIMTVADLDKMEARVDVDENDVVLIRDGQEAIIEIDAFKDMKFNGKVTQIGNSAKSRGLGTQDEVVNFEVRILLVDKHERIRPGMSCDADIKTATRENVFSVPIQSVTARMDESEYDENTPASKRKPKEVVFVVVDKKVKMKEVKTGISDDDYYEIISGLEENEKVVSGPYRALSKELEDGKRVVVQEKRKKGKKKEQVAEASNN
ncbi:MAG: efflux RND transporter periplasmic adaptor subunit [Rhodothermaceae bacterium]